jgi:acetyl-CoA carboxylase biotin carboxyl carrier protein
VDLKHIKELMAAMRRGGIKKLMIKEKAGYEIHLEAQEEHPAMPPAAAHITYHQPFLSPVHSIKEVEVARNPQVAVSPTQKTESLSSQEGGRFVTAPLVGTFYNAASPEDPPFIKVGDRIEENTVLCIVEAMKVMNEVKAGMSGIVAEILVENAHTVEFGTKLFRIT